MALSGLATHTPEQYEVAVEGKKPLKIRIILFFDGTLNNRMNIAEREKAELGQESESYQDFKTDDANSYDNGRTNIAIMEPHVSDKKQDYAGDYDFVYKHYIPGQGALTRRKDSIWGYALAIGESGVPRRAEEGINYAVNSILLDKKIEPQRQYIQKLTIDVFGFSRGAATARYAIHVIFNGRISGVNEDTGDAQYEWQPVFHRLNRFDFIIAEKAVEVGFAGLYDTVLSYAGSQKIPWTTNALQQRAVARAKKVLHLAAADEHRADFSLHKIKSAVDKGVGEEYFLPGVHSDIGGSYNLANEKLLEQLELSKFDESEIQYMRTSDEGCKDLERNWWGKISDKTMVIHKGDPARLKEDRDQLVKEGWYTEKEITIVDLAWDDLGQATHSMLTVFRQGIRSAYCNIPLKIMAKYARGKDVKLIINSLLEDRANTILKPERDLRDLEEKIIAYIDSKCESKPEHWMGVDALIKHPELKSIRHRHFHFSASKWSPGYNLRHSHFFAGHGPNFLVLYGPWKTWTPSFQNLKPSNGSANASRRQT